MEHYLCHWDLSHKSAWLKPPQCLKFDFKYDLSMLSPSSQCVRHENVKCVEERGCHTPYTASSGNLWNVILTLLYLYDWLGYKLQIFSTEIWAFDKQWWFSFFPSQVCLGVCNIKYFLASNHFTRDSLLSPHTRLKILK